jgi:hypothetical protein
MYSRNYQYGGLGEVPVTPQTETTDEAYKLVFNQILQNGDHFPDLRIPIPAEGDVLVTDIFGSSTGAFSIQFFDQAGRPMSSAEMNSVNAMGTAQLPVPFGGITYPRSGQIRVSITNLLAGVNTIQIVLSGMIHRQPK